MVCQTRTVADTAQTMGQPLASQPPGASPGAGPRAAPSGRGAACRPGLVSSGPRPVGPQLLLKQIPRRSPSSPTGKWGA